MKKTVKVVLLTVCVLIVACSAVLGTIAYLTDTENVVNTFSVGKVDISLDETKVNPDGTPVADENGQPVDRVKENEYHLMPGCEYTKDPMITVEPNSEEAYVRMIMVVHNASAVQAMIDAHGLTDFSDLIGGWDESVWLYNGFEEDAAANTISFEFRYKDTVSAQDDAVELEPLFTTLIVPGDATSAELEALYDGGFKMEVIGHAIQVVGFADDAYAGVTAEDAAWAAFEAQV